MHKKTQKSLMLGLQGDWKNPPRMYLKFLKVLRLLFQMKQFVKCTFARGRYLLSKQSLLKETKSFCLIEILSIFLFLFVALGFTNL